MKNFVLLLIAFISFLEPSSAQTCFPQGIVFANQLDIEEFERENPDCSVIEGNVLIVGSNVKLVGLDQIIEIQGDLIIENIWNLESIDGFHNLETVGGRLSFSFNPKLKEIKAFESLISIGDDLIFFANWRIESILGFENLESIQDSFLIRNNGVRAMPNFNKLNLIGGAFIFKDNHQTFTMNGFEQLARVGGNLEIQSNELLDTINGFDQLISIGGYAFFRFTKLHEFNGFSALESVNGNFRFDGS